MIKWNRTYTIYAVFMFLLLLAGWYLGQQYFIEPKIKRVEQTEETLAEHQQIIEAAARDGLVRESIQEELDAIWTQLPIEQNSAQIILTLNELEEQSNVLLQEINVSSDTLPIDQRYYPNDVTSVNYQLSFTAESSSDFELFIVQLSDLEQMIEIDRLNFQQTTTDGVTGTLVFRVFYSDAVKID